MSNLYNISLLSISLIVLLQLLVVFILARYIGQFISKIESIHGIKIGTLMEGQDVPYFREKDDMGRNVISKDIFEKRTVLLFVNTNCATCKEVIPEINSIINTYSIQFLVINTDENHEDTLIKDTLARDIPYLRSNKISSLYSISKVPFALIIESNIVQATAELKNKNSLWNMLINEEKVAS
jgi:thiol-disulfide isomerase/thioredoxin